MKRLLNVWALLAIVAMPALAQTPTPEPAPPLPLPLSIPEISGAPMTPEQEKEALDYILSDASDRDAAERAEQARKGRAPEVYWARLRTELSHKQQMAELKAKDPQTYAMYQRELALHRKVDNLLRQYRQAGNDAARDKVRTDLKSALSELFDVHEQLRTTTEVARLQREIREEQENTASRRTQKDQIVAEQLRQFTASSGKD